MGKLVHSLSSDVPHESLSVMDCEFPVVLAPMVRASTTPLRLLALRYGATHVYSEEIIDRSILSCVRQLNPSLGTVDFVKKPPPSKKQRKAGISSDVLVFRVHRPSEAGKLIFQMGTCSPELAAKAAQLVAEDVDGIDVNMGCPKKFSTSGGMGSELLKFPAKAAAIIEALVQATALPVSCKIRLVGSPEDDEETLVAQTKAFMRQMETAGASHITLHARTAGDSSTEAAAKRRWDTIDELFECVKIPVLLNGDVYTPEDVESIKKRGKAGGVMIARGALYDCSIFRQVAGGKRASPDEVMQEYLQLCVQFDNHFINTKYVVCEFINSRRYPPEIGLVTNQYSDGQTLGAICATKSNKELCGLWSLEVEGTGGGEGLDKKYSDDYFLKNEPGGAKPKDCVLPAKRTADEVQSGDIKRLRGSPE